MPCSSCGKSQPVRVERIGTGQINLRQRIVSTQKLGSRKLLATTVTMSPAHDLDKYRA